jgi:hypothetical protein
MVRTHGWGLRGQRLRGQAPHGHWQTLTFLAALRHDRIDAPCVLDGPINGESFKAYIEQFLVPTLKPGDIVIMDNLGSHKGHRVENRRHSYVDGAGSVVERQLAPCVAVLCQAPAVSEPA